MSASVIYASSHAIVLAGIAWHIYLIDYAKRHLDDVV